MPLLGRVEREISELVAAHNAALSKLNERKRQVIRRMFIRCRECRSASRLASWGFIQKLWYVRPTGCTEGDYWKHHETETCDLVCPKCRKRNYIYNHPQKERILAVTIKGIGKAELFATVTEEHDKD